MRGLQQEERNDVVGDEAQPTRVTVVSSAEQLKGAIQQGIEHIEIRRHLDLTGLSLDEAQGGTLLGDVPAAVKSVQVCISFFCQSMNVCLLPHAAAAVNTFRIATVACRTEPTADGNIFVCSQHTAKALLALRRSRFTVS